MNEAGSPSHLLGYAAEEALEEVHITQIYPAGVAKGIIKKLRSPEMGRTGKLEGPSSRKEAKESALLGIS